MRVHVFICLFALGFVACSYLPETPVEMSGISLEEHRDFLLVEPEDSRGISETGLIFYPGGLVDPHAYLSMASAFARSGRGHRVIIAKMPSNLAVLDITAARDIVEEQDLENWVMAGHSLGGAMACSMVEKKTGLFQGLVLMAAYPSGSVDLSAWNRPVLSVTASEDLVIDMEKFHTGRTRLPPATRYELIEGGNHAGFGHYGEQKGDGTATISQAAQQALLIELLQSYFLEYGLD